VNRTSQRSDPKADRPGHFWGIDMAKFIVSSIGWFYLVIVLDWITKKSVRLDSEIVGWDLSLRRNAADWDRPLERAFEREFPHGVRGVGLKLVNENGSQPTSVAFMRDMRVLGIEQIFTYYLALRIILRVMRIRSVFCGRSRKSLFGSNNHKVVAFI